MEGCQIILLITDERPKYSFELCMLLWMNSYGRYFDIALSVKYSRWVFATIVLLESSHKFSFVAFRCGAWYMYLDLLYGCDNLINRLTNKAKVLAWSLYFTMVLFETSSRLKLHFAQKFKPNVSYSASLYYNPWGTTCWILWWFFTYNKLLVCLDVLGDHIMLILICAMI